MSRTKRNKPGGVRREAGRRAKKLALRKDRARSPEPEWQTPRRAQGLAQKTSQPQKRLSVGTESKNAQSEVVLISSSCSEDSSDDDDDRDPSVAGERVSDGDKALPEKIAGMAQVDAILISDDEDELDASRRTHTEGKRDATVVTNEERGFGRIANAAILQDAGALDFRGEVEETRILPSAELATPHTVPGSNPPVPTEPRATRKTGRPSKKAQDDGPGALYRPESPGVKFDDQSDGDDRRDIEELPTDPQIILTTGERQFSEQVARKEHIKRMALRSARRRAEREQRADKEVEEMNDMLEKGKKIDPKMEARVAERRAVLAKRQKKAREKKERIEQREKGSKKTARGAKGGQERVERRQKSRVKEKGGLPMLWDPYLQADRRFTGAEDNDTRLNVEAIVAITSSMQRLLEASAFEFTAKHDPEFAAKNGTAHGLELHVWIRDGLSRFGGRPALRSALCRDMDMLLHGEGNTVLDGDKWSQCLQAVTLIRHTATHRICMDSEALIQCIGAAVHLLDAMRDDRALEIANKLQILVWSTQKKLERDVGELQRFIDAAAKTKKQFELEQEVLYLNSDAAIVNSNHDQTESTGKESPSEEGEIREVPGDGKPEKQFTDPSSVNDLMAMVLDIKADGCAKLVKHVNTLFEDPGKIQFRVDS